VRELGKIGFLKCYLLEKGDDTSKLELTETCYLLGGTGLFMYKSNELFKAIVRTDVPNSCDVKPLLETNLPKIPRIYIDQAISFFKKIYDIHKTEAALILYWNKSAFKWSCPKQKVSGGSVNYTEDHPGEGWLPILHMHSHADMSAFHSGVDNKDEKYVDGYNITIGKLNDIFEFECRIMVGKADKKVKMSEIIEDWITEVVFPNDWLNNVETPTHSLVVGKQTTLFSEIDRGSVFVTPSDNTYDGIYLLKNYGGIL
jgi:hypothetical protein